MKRRLATVMRQLGKDALTICWQETAGGTEDAVSKAMVGGTPTEKSFTVNAFLHWPQVGGSTAARNFTEIDDGDVIVDMTAEDAAAHLAGKTGLSFLIQGVRYRQKRVSDRLSASWDAVIGTTPLARPLLLEVAR
jgi:hypothetical protein